MDNARSSLSYLKNEVYRIKIFLAFFVNRLNCEFSAFKDKWQPVQCVYLVFSELRKAKEPSNLY